MSEIIEQQLFRRNIAYPWLFRFSLVCTVYKSFAIVHEKLRLMKYLSLLDEIKTKRIALWNGQKLPNITIVKAAEYYGTEIVYFENGLLPNTATCDLEGVNAKNALPRNKEFYLDLKLDTSKLSEALVVRPIHKQRKKEKVVALPKRYLFLPFQVPNDSQVVVNSPWIRTMEQLLEETMTAVDKLRDESLIVVVKEHPSWKHSHSYLHGRYNNVIFANGNSTEHLIRNSLAVLTINSTVGIEALLLNKSVITLGEACYNIDGLVQHACDPQALLQALINLKHWQCESVLRQKYLNFLSSVYSIPTKWSLADSVHFNAIESRLTHQDLYNHYLD